MTLILGDSIEKMKEMPDNSVDAVVTDPPYGWRFMGKSWDTADILLKSRQAKRPGETYVGSDGVTRKTRADASMAAGKYDQSLEGNLAFCEWTREWAIEALRVLKPGGHALIFCGPRTYHAMAMGVEMAGFEIRDQMQWLFGSGFPKSLNLKNEWQGWGTALKPANEPIVLARKPLEKGLTVAENVLKWGAGALNVDAGRIGNEQVEKGRAGRGKHSSVAMNELRGSNMANGVSVGRWPANVLFDEEAAAMVDEQSGNLSKQGSRKLKDCPSATFSGGSKDSTFYGDSGGASRFFYVAKASKRERNEGLEGLEGLEVHRYGAGIGQGKDPSAPTIDKNHHPTVKPIKLMEYLCKLITPPGGVVLDPFMGSGTTGCAAVKLGFQFIGIEREEEYMEIARRRVEYWEKQTELIKSDAAS